MNKNFDTSMERNSYEGNGWSKYQILVLQQLDDHNKVLQNLNKEIVDIKQNIAVSETELKMWRAQIMSSVERLTEQVDDILYDESGLSYKIRNLEKTQEVDQRVEMKAKAVWAVIGAGLTLLINFLLKIAEIYWK
jgi:predicted  nucleic acid-binding Zn-ribbon protein